jgi:transposase
MKAANDQLRGRPPASDIVDFLPTHPSNGFVEGENNRTKALMRQGYGYCNRTKALMRQGYGYCNRRHLRLRILLEVA